MNTFDVRTLCLKSLISIAVSFLFFSVVKAETSYLMNETSELNKFIEPVEVEDFYFVEGVSIKSEPQYYSDYFGRIPVNSSVSHVWKISNNDGLASLRIERITISGIMFKAYGNCPIEIPPGGSCKIRIQFSPFALGLFRGLLEIKFTDNKGLIQIDAMGEAY